MISNNAQPPTKSMLKYLASYAEPETQIARERIHSTEDKDRWQYCLIIPAYKESKAFYQRLASSLLKQHAVLLVLVINQPDSLTSPHPDNALLWHQLIDSTVEQDTSSNILLRSIPHTNSTLLLIDRFNAGLRIPEKQGVGLARKIGADIALSLINSGHVTHPWIYTTDADTHLPSNYFTVLDSHISSHRTALPAAATYPFKHLCDATPVGQATELYEQRLHQYVDGLHTAGSSYAFQTIGSTIAISATHYAQVRGFPKRSGGEDFYLLNKLAKTGGINSVQEAIITIEARQSDRVPFGTGPAINKLLLEKNISQANIFYHPQIFVELKRWLEKIHLTQTNSLCELSLSTSTLEALRTLGAAQAIAAARKVSTSASSYKKHIHTWFDAFKTLRFVHCLQEQAYPSVNTTDLLTALSCSAKTKK